MHIKLTFILVLLFCLNLFATDFFTDKGSLWLGGSGGYHCYVENDNIFNDNITDHSFSLSPMVRFFPYRYFFIGPDLGWGCSFNKSSYVYNILNAGLEGGFAFGKNEHIIPYVKTGATYLLEIISRSNTYMQSDNVIHGIEVPVTIGLMIPLFNSIGLQIQSGYEFQLFGHIRSNNFGFSFGFCGIGKKSAVSLLGNL
jgi:hypothetical protein